MVVDKLTTSYRYMKYAHVSRILYLICVNFHTLIKILNLMPRPVGSNLSHAAISTPIMCQSLAQATGKVSTPGTLPECECKAEAHGELRSTTNYTAEQRGQRGEGRPPITNSNTD